MPVRQVWQMQQVNGQPVVAPPGQPIGGLTEGMLVLKGYLCGVFSELLMTTITSAWPSGGSQSDKRSSAPTRSGSSWQGMTTTIFRAGCGLALISRGPADFCRYFSWDASTCRLGNLASCDYPFNGITANIT